MKISDYLDTELILFLDVESQRDAIESLIERLDERGKLPDKEAFRKAIDHREQLVSTGIGMGVAVPHAKMPSLSEFFIAIGVQKQKGIEWNALDKAPVRIIFMIGGPDNRQTEYLNILSMLTAFVKDPELRKKILHAKSPADLFELFTGIYPFRSKDT